MGAARAGEAFSVSCPAFAQGKPMPGIYALTGKNIPPEVRVQQAPANAQSLVLIVDDPDAPAGRWTHWLVWNLPSNLTALVGDSLPSGARVGKNSFQHVRYDGPAPPPGTGAHRYFFRLYALDATLPLATGADRAQLLTAMKGHIVGIAETYGTYQTPP